jgi:hypothetical protein
MRRLDMNDGWTQHKDLPTLQDGLANFENLVYAGPMYAGTPTQGSGKGKFVYDTGSGYFVISGNDCTTCNSKYYRPATSSTSK